MTVNRPHDQQMGPSPLTRRGVAAVDAGLEVVSSPVALWVRLGIAGVLGSVLTGLGTMVGFIVIASAAAGPLNDFGSPIGPVVGGAACIALGAIVFAGGWSTFKAYRRRGLI